MKNKWLTIKISFFKSLFLLLISTINAQENWDIVNSGTTDNLIDVCFVDNHHGWILGRSGTLIRVRDTNSPNSWDSDTLQYQNLNAIQFVNLNIGWIVGDNGLILKSIDGGTNWIEQEGGQNYYLDDLFFVDEQVGFICGGSTPSNKGIILRTTNGGSQWDEIVLSIYSPRLLSIYFLNTNLGWTTGTYNTVYRTTDAGISWDSIAYLAGGITNSHFGVYFSDSLNGNICGVEYHGTGNNNSAIYKTSDGGFSWTFVAGVGYGLFYSLAHHTLSNSLYSVGYGGYPHIVGQIYKSTNGGNDWSEITCPTSEHLNKITFTQYKGWIVGRNGTILKSLISTSVEETDYLLIYYLLQNYPNPFNPSTTIKYKIPEISFVTLKIYDVLGNEISTLVKEEKPAGSYKVKFDASGFPSGIYFYQLQAGSFVETKKMVLLK